TVKATIEWSYSLLAREEQVLFARLAVFVGGCALEAVEAVCAAEPGANLDLIQDSDRLLEHISALVNSSLVRRERRANGDERFGMLEMVREYALACLAAEGANSGAIIRRRHAEYYLNMVLTAKPELIGPRQQEWMARFASEVGNLRVA